MKTSLVAAFTALLLIGSLRAESTDNNNNSTAAKKVDDDDTWPSDCLSNYDEFLSPPQPTPYLVSIQVLSQDEPRWHHRCTGTIIAADMVLMSAQCAIDLPHFSKFYQVVAGITRLYAANETSRQVRTIERIHFHPAVGELQYPAEAYDVAIVVLTAPFKLTKQVRPVSLAPTAGGDENFAASKCVYSDWIYMPNSNCFKRRQQKLRFIGMKACEDVVKDLNPDKTNEISKCYEPTGPESLYSFGRNGPLICNGGVITGIASFERAKGSPNVRLFTDIKNVLPWILRVINGVTCTAGN